MCETRPCLSGRGLLRGIVDDNAGDGIEGHPQLDARAFVDLDGDFFLVTIDLVYDAENSADGDDSIIYLHIAQHALTLILVFSLGSYEEQIEEDEYGQHHKQHGSDAATVPGSEKNLGLRQARNHVDTPLGDAEVVYFHTLRSPIAQRAATESAAGGNSRNLC
jgi:hypothetical protein